MRILLIGSTGQLGSALVASLQGEEVAPLTHSEIEVSDPASVRRAFERYRPEVVITTAAYHRVDDGEREIETAFHVNAFAVCDLALACREYHAVLVHFSTDYVFGGDQEKPYLETDLPRPLNVYGASKLAGENLLTAALDRHFLIRTCGIYGSGSRGGNFVEAVLRRAAQGQPVRVVADQVVSPTYAVDLARKVAELISTNAYGLYHISNLGSCSWFEFSRCLFHIGGIQADLCPITSEAYGASARRPRYSVLRNRHLEQIGLDPMPAWEDALARYLQERESPPAPPQLNSAQ
jgi:dTDP-4-dehydrorhamnose reductase